MTLTRHDNVLHSHAYPCGHCTGPTKAISEDQRKLTAFHEAGHAIVGINLLQHDPVHKATIIPRGNALGLVFSLPKHDLLSMTKVKYKSQIAMAMGGRVAEELIFGAENVTSGASSDINYATNIASAMVMRFGMSKKLGNVDYRSASENGTQKISPDTQSLIDIEIRRLVDQGYQTAISILLEKESDLRRVAEGLLIYETLTGSEIAQVISGEVPSRFCPV